VRGAIFGLAVVAFGASPVAAGAQSRESLAEGLFRTARAEMKAGNFASACPKLEESYRLDPVSGTLLNKAVCDESRGRKATAWTEYLRFVQTAPAGDARLPFATARIRLLEPQLARLRITILAAPAGSTLSLDDVALGSAIAGVDLPIDNGSHVAVLVALDGRRVERRFSVEDGEQMGIELELPKAPVSVITSGPVPDGAAGGANSPVRRARTPLRASRSSSRPLLTAGYVTMGVGLAGLASAGILTVLASNEKGTVNAHCPGRLCDDEGLRAASHGAALLRAADVGLVVGALGVLGGGYLLYRAWSVKPVVGGSSNSVVAALEGTW
jgi:hypothetical protein